MLSLSIKGLCFNRNIQILEVSSDRIVFQAQNPQGLISRDSKVFLHSHGFSKTLTGHLEAIDIQKGLFELSYITSLPNAWKSRLHDRVQPKNATYVSLLYRRDNFRAYLGDISAQGMKLLVNQTIRRTKIQTGATVHVDFQLRSGDRPFRLKGNVVYIQEIDNLLMKLGLRLFPKVREARTLMSYIADRKKEIQEEMDQTYIKTYELPGVECQYF